MTYKNPTRASPNMKSDPSTQHHTITLSHYHTLALSHSPLSALSSLSRGGAVFAPFDSAAGHLAFQATLLPYSPHLAAPTSPTVAAANMRALRTSWRSSSCLLRSAPSPRLSSSLPNQRSRSIDPTAHRTSLSSLCVASLSALRPPAATSAPSISPALLSSSSLTASLSASSSQHSPYSSAALLSSFSPSPAAALLPCESVVDECASSSATGLSECCLPSVVARVDLCHLSLLLSPGGEGDDGA